MKHTATAYGLACVLLICMACAGWAQNGVWRDSIGAIAGGRGGTDVAHADTGAILIDNPAGMVNADGNGLFELSADGLINHTHFSDHLNDISNQIRPMALPELSYFQKSSDNQWAFGLGVFVPAGFGTQYDLVNPVFGLQKTESFGALIKILPGFAYHVTDRLSIGGTFGAGISTIQLEGPLRVQTGVLAGAPVLLHIHGTDAAPTWSAGMQYVLSEQTTLGVAYTDETRVHLDGHLDADVATPGPRLLYSKFDSEMDLVWPRSVTAGFTQVLTPRQRLSTDVSWIQWSSAFNGLDLKLSGASNPLFTALLGPSIHDRIPLDWKDGVSVRVGYEYLLTPSDVVRAGYIWDSRVIPTSTLTPYIPAILENTFTFGYGRRWENCRFDIAYQFSFGEPQSVSQSALAGGDFNNSQFRTNVHWLMVSFGYQF